MLYFDSQRTISFEMNHRHPKLLLKLASVLPLLVSFRTLAKQSFGNEVSFMHFGIEFRKTFFES